MSYTETAADGTVFGNVSGIQAGTFFRSRRELHDKKLHRGLMNGIATRGSSIVLSGGYVDDEDLGDVIIYTGEGGRDQRTGRQIADQQLTAGNLALAEIHLRGIKKTVVINSSTSSSLAFEERFFERPRFRSRPNL